MKCELKYGTHYIIKSIKEEFDFETIIAGMISACILLLIYINAYTNNLWWYLFGYLGLFSILTFPVLVVYSTFKVYKKSIEYGVKITGDSTFKVYKKSIEWCKKNR